MHVNCVLAYADTLHSFISLHFIHYTRFPPLGSGTYSPECVSAGLLSWQQAYQLSRILMWSKSALDAFRLTVSLCHAAHVSVTSRCDMSAKKPDACILHFGLDMIYGLHQHPRLNASSSVPCCSCGCADQGLGFRNCVFALLQAVSIHCLLST